MYGKTIGNGNIYVDCFPLKDNGICFLTESNIDEPLPDYIDRVYTSPHIGMLLRTRCGVHEDNITCLPVNQRLLIVDKLKNLNFFVTLIDAMQTPGGVMYLFESKDFGNILYAGKCAYGSNFLKSTKSPLNKFIDSESLDCLYIHETWMETDVVSLPAAIRQTVQHIRSNPMQKVTIHEPCFREDILSDLWQKIQKRICVSENIMKHLELVGLGSDFTLDPNGVKFFITDDENIKKHKSQGSEVNVFLIPRSLRISSDDFQCKKEKWEGYGYKVVVYRDHCTLSELRTLVNKLNPKRTVLISPVQNPNSWSFLGDVSKIMEFSFESMSNNITPKDDEINLTHDQNDSTLPLGSDDGSVVSHHTVLNPIIELSP